MSELLLELFCEEIPARMQREAATALRKAVADACAAQSLSFETMESYVTPRRLILHVVGLPERTPDIREERRGPKIDAPQKALDGFLKSVGLAREQLTLRNEGKAQFFFAEVHKAGRPTAAALADILPQVLRGFSWPKSMRWGERSCSMDSLRWVRPLHTILCLLDGEVVSFEIEGIRSGNITRGHRFHSNSPFPVDGFEDYRTKLKLSRVLIDSEERARIIETQARKLASDAGLELVEDSGLLAENAGLTEWPVPLLGSFDTDFLSVPPEVIQLTMRTNQKYFALRDAASGALSNHFICTANIEASDGGKAIVAGNEKVLAARLSDARFFWEQDSKKKLEDFLPKLKEIIFHEKLGTVADKVARVAALARELAPVCGANPDLAERAAQLCKADLVTGMVGEFPELQGVMGAYYAEKQGEPADVVRAIREHYAPQGPGDACPTAPVSVAVALADKLDTLASFFGVLEVPTGSRDPYALRRAALGLLRIIQTHDICLNISMLFELCWKVYKEISFQTGLVPVRLELDHSTNDNTGAKSTWTYRVELIDDIENYVGKFDNEYYIMAVQEIRYKQGMILTSSDLEGYTRYWMPHPTIFPENLKDFLIDRLKVQQRDRGVPHDLIDAVFSLGGEDDLVRLLARVRALQAFLGTDDGKLLLAGYKRAANILRIEEKKDGRAYDSAVESGKLEQAEEVALHAALADAQSAAAKAVAAEQFEATMAALARLRTPIDAFFDKVTVNANDPALRANRLNLLAAIRAAVHTVADFSKIEG